MKEKNNLKLTFWTKAIALSVVVALGYQQLLWAGSFDLHSLRPLAATESRRKGISRRTFVKWVGLGAAAVTAGGLSMKLITREDTELPNPYEHASKESAVLKGYFDTLDELSPPSWQNSDMVYIAPTDVGLGDAYEAINNMGGTMAGVGFSQNFSFAVHGKFFTVITDINPVLTEVLVPFMGYVVEQNKTRRRILSSLLGVSLTDEDVERLLEPGPKKVKAADLREYLLATLKEITGRTLFEERRHWYHGYSRNVLEHQVFDRLRKNGRVKDEGEIRKAREIFDKFLNPDTLSDEIADEEGQEYQKFVDFLMYHAWVSLEAEDRLGTWMSNEENCEALYNSWCRGDIIGMTVDLTDENTVSKLGSWLGRNKKPPAVFFNESNVASWVGPEKTKDMRNAVLARLPMHEEPLILVSGGPGLAARVCPFYLLMLRDEYISRGEITPWDFFEHMGTVMGKGEAVYDKLLANLGVYLLSLDDYGKIEELPDRKLKFIFSKKWQDEYGNYMKLIDHMKASKGEISNLGPDGFTAWVQEWAKSNKFEFSTETLWFRGFVWNLVDARVIKSWPRKTEEARSIKEIEENLKSNKMVTDI